MNTILSRIMAIVIVAIISLCACEKTELIDFGLNEESIEFTHEGHILKGILSKPEGIDHFPVVVFVHGDGPSDRYEQGYYKYIWKQLNEQGIACLAWDKQGVGQSSGNWLEQSIDDRAKEVVAAVQMLKERTDVEKISLWGISQGAWVAPKAYVLDTSIAAVVLQSAAVNWLTQGSYHLQKRLEKKNYSSAQLNELMAYHEAGIDLLYAKDYIAYKNHFNEQSDFIKSEFSLMSEERWGFVVLNFETDIRADLQALDAPVLALLGAKDENVNAQETQMVFADIFAQNGNDRYECHFFEEADHGLFDVNKKGEPNTENDIWYKLLYKGEDVFAAGYIESAIGFLQGL